jgi:iron complex transport system ATP-binding protein
VLDAALLTEVYGIRVEVDHDPRTGAVRTRPVGRHASRIVGTTCEHRTHRNTARTGTPRRGPP